MATTIAARRARCRLSFHVGHGRRSARFEEAARALFADDRRRFTGLIADWPQDIRDHVVKLAFGDRADPPRTLTAPSTAHADRVIAAIGSFPQRGIRVRRQSAMEGLSRFLAPMMLSNLLQSLFGTVNSVYLGQMIGVDALAARLGVLPGDVLLLRLRHRPEHRRQRADRPGLGRRRARHVKAVAGTTLAVALLLSLSVATSAACSAGN